MYRYRPFFLSLFSVLVAGSDSPHFLNPRDSINTSSLNSSMVSTAWYAGWHVADLPLSAVSWSKYTEINYAFALTTPDPNIISVVESDEILLPQFVTAAHKHNVKASLSIGGWTGSRWFSANVGSAQNRTAFVKSVVGLVKKYKLDGIDFDWEFPGVQGIGCNLVNSNDTANFLSFLQELRPRVGSNLTLSAAVYVTPFANPSGSPSTDISGFSQVLDYIVIMNYDIKSTPSTGAGPSAPLNDSCAPSASQYGSAASAVTMWTNAGMPSNQIVLGVPAYGHSFRVPQSAAFLNGSDSLAPYPTYNISNTPPGDKWNGEGGLDVCGVYQAPGGTYAFRSLVEDGLLNTDGTVKAGIPYRYDACSDTPYIYNPQTEIMISFENAQSFGAKGDFIRATGLRGLAVWEAAGDAGNVLIDAILNGTINGAPRTKTGVPQPTISSPSPSSGDSLSPRSSPIPLLALLWCCVLFYI